jgi:hypothetical protein
VVCHVVDFGTELYLVRFRNIEGFQKGKVEVDLTRPNQWSVAAIAELVGESLSRCKRRRREGRLVVPARKRLMAGGAAQRRLPYGLKEKLRGLAILSGHAQ